MAIPQTNSMQLSPKVYAQELFSGHGEAMERLRMQVARIAPHFRMALITGEAGTGKHAVAMRMHSASPAAAGAFVTVPAAEFARCGEPAPAHGTMYLPGLEELDATAQAGLLRGLKMLSRETRVIVASRSDLRGMVSAGRLRQDLYERVGTLHIRVPALHERGDDLAVIAAGMLRQRNSQATLQSSAIARLRRHPLRDNLRQLWALCEQLAPESKAIEAADLPALDGAASGADEAPKRLEDVMYRHVMEVLETCAGNKLRAAEVLGISRSTLYRMLGAGPGLGSGPDSMRAAMR